MIENKKKAVKNSKKKAKEPTFRDLLKLEIAAELGLMDKVQKYGWGGLSAAETGRIGGIMTSKIKNQKTTDINK